MARHTQNGLSLSYYKDAKPYKLDHIRTAIRNYSGQIQATIIPTFVNYKIECMPTAHGIRRRVSVIYPEKFPSQTMICDHCNIENIEDRMVIWLTDDQKDRLFQ